MDLEKTLSRQEMLSISKPARYIGREWNISLKKEEDVEISVALAFPDLYEIGMSHLGLKIFTIFSILPGVRERACSWPDMGKMMKEKHSLYSLENKFFVTLTGRDKLKT